MKKILFVCLGNICRSVMAEYMMKDYCESHNITDVFIDSAGVSSEEAGNPIYPPAKRELIKNGIKIGNHKARKIEAQDYQKFDLILCAEDFHVGRAKMIFGSDPQNKIKRMLDFTDTPGNIADPWYSGDFSLTFSQLSAVCRGLEKYL